jgi:hypothetical protein
MVRFTWCVSWGENGRKGGTVYFEVLQLEEPVLITALFIMGGKSTSQPKSCRSYFHWWLVSVKR